jgi:hypothetical protein
MKYFFCNLLLVAMFMTSAHAVEIESLHAATIDVQNLPTATEGRSLTINGIVDMSPVVLDVPTLEKFGLSSYQVNDPWLNKQVRYTGVLLASFLQQLGVAKDRSILVIAADGYQFRIPATEYNRWPVLLASQSDAGALGDMGPVRIIFPYDDHDNAKAARNMSVWAVVALTIE